MTTPEAFDAGVARQIGHHIAGIAAVPAGKGR
jgi:hypothetical protein